MLYLHSESVLWFGRHEGETIWEVFLFDFEYIIYCYHYLPNFNILEQDIEDFDFELHINETYIKTINDKKNLPSEEDLLYRLGIRDKDEEFKDYCYRPDDVEVNDDKEYEYLQEINEIEVEGIPIPGYDEISNNEVLYEEIQGCNNFPYEDEGSSYSKYEGYNGWDDDTIDSAFDGDPMNTWNVD